MRFHLWILVFVLCHSAILKLCSFNSTEPFLTWKIDFDEGLEYVHFSKDVFTNFYSYLCMQSTEFYKVRVQNSNVIFEGQLTNQSLPPDKITRYECAYEKTEKSFTCTKAQLGDPVCTNTTNCFVYEMETISGTEKCDLPFVKISLSPNVPIQANFSSTTNAVNVTACAPGCSVEAFTTTYINVTTPTYYTVANATTFTSSSPSSSSGLTSGLTNEQIIIIGLAVGLVILIVALIILGVIVWRRRQKPRDNIKSSDITARRFTNHNNGIVNNGRNYASDDDDIIHPNSISKASTTVETETKDTKNQYETVDLDPDPEQGNLTKSSIKSKNKSSIKSSDSKKRALPAVLESPYSEPETKHVTGPYSTVDLDDAVGNVTITSDKPENESSPKLPEPRSKDTPSPSKNPYSEPETKNLTDPYTRINPNTKSQKKKNTADLQNMEEAEHDIPNHPSKGTGGAEGNVSALSSHDEQTASGDEEDASKFLPDDESANAYSKLHETQRHFQNPYNILSDPLNDAPDEPPANLPSSNVDITPETATSIPAVDLPVHKDVASDNGDKAIDDDNDAISELDNSECDSDKNDENREPDVAMHVSDNEEIKVQTDKGTLEYPSPTENKTSATSPTETGTAKKNEYFQLESDAESSTEEEEGLETEHHCAK